MISPEKRIVLKSFAVTLLLFVAALLVGPGEALAYANDADPNRILCGLPHAEEKRLLANTISDDVVVGGAESTGAICPLASSKKKKCPMKSGATSLLDCCCLKQGNADARHASLKDTHSGPALAVRAGRSIAAPGIANGSKPPSFPSDYFDTIPSPPPESPLPF